MQQTANGNMCNDESIVLCGRIGTSTQPTPGYEVSQDLLQRRQPPECRGYVSLDQRLGDPSYVMVRCDVLYHDWVNGMVL